MASFEINKAFVFDSAHYLPHVPAEHRCKRMHGHTYRVTVYVEGEIDGDTGWVCDCVDIKTAMTPIVALLDHNCLNDVAGLENPTTENLAVWLWQKLERDLQGLCKIRIQASHNTVITYFGP